MRYLFVAFVFLGCGEAFVVDGAGGAPDVKGNTPDSADGGGGMPDGSGAANGNGTGGQSSGSGGGSTLCQPGVCGAGSDERKSYCAVESKGNVSAGDCVRCEKKWYDCNDDGADGCEVKSPEGHPCPVGDNDDD